MTRNYKQVEKELTTIINSNIETTNEAKLKINIYYKSRKIKNLFIRNNPKKPDQPFNVVYQYTCNQGECTTSQSTYIGHTRTTIKDSVIRKFHPRKFHPRKFHPRKFHPRKFHPRKFHPRKFHPRKFHPRKFHPRKFHPAKIPPSENSTQRKLG